MLPELGIDGRNYLNYPLTAGLLNFADLIRLVPAC